MENFSLENSLMLKKNIIKNHSIFIYIDINFIKRNLNLNIFKILMLDK